MNPPNLNKADPINGPMRYPNEVVTSEIAIFYSIDSGNNSGINA
jgi:hypothetical protein